MQYTTLGKTGLKVSRLGFGAMRLPMKEDRVDRELAIPILHRAFEGGLNYVEAGFYESITLQYNMLDRKLEEAIACARGKEVGIVVMGPVAGGRLGTPNEAFAHLVPGIERIPELALRFVLANPNVTLALSGMSSVQQVEENLEVASNGRVLEGEELSIIDEQLARLKKMADTYCTGCGYCLPCPESVDIPKVFKLYNDARVYGFEENSRKKYADWLNDPPSDSLPADACAECAACEEECPQKIPIRRQLKEAHAFLNC